ncbi:hypothetical protein [Desertimonas flava]|nr:hypothetical protein [Desertimonas flava]
MRSGSGIHSSPSLSGPVIGLFDTGRMVCTAAEMTVSSVGVMLAASTITV